jgi:hypothetical protein
LPEPFRLDEGKLRQALRRAETGRGIGEEFYDKGFDVAGFGLQVALGYQAADFRQGVLLRIARRGLADLLFHLAAAEIVTVDDGDTERSLLGGDIRGVVDWVGDLRHALYCALPITSAARPPAIA